MRAFYLTNTKGQKQSGNLKKKSSEERLARVAIALLVLFLVLPVFTVSVSAETAEGKAGEETATETATEPTPKSSWQKDAGGWKYFDEAGNPITDKWSKIGDRWYHFSKAGYMQHGWLKDNDRWYYLGWQDDPESGAMRHGWLKLDDRWYYFGSPDDPESGAMRHGWFKDNDRWCYMGWEDDAESGAMRRGWAELGDKWYYFGWPEDDNSGAMRRGWLELKDAWYYLGNPNNDDSGAMVTGVANTKKSDEDAKYYFFNENGAWKETCRNTSQDGTDWVVIKGVANKVVTESDKTLYRAMNLLVTVTNDSMTDEQKLRAAFDHIKNGYVEFNPRIPHDRSWNWPVIYANDIFVGTGSGRTGRKGGNCLSCAAAFGYMAKAIGYEGVYACNSGGHGWIEIDGKVYDPEWERHHTGSFYARPLVSGESQNYKGAISRSASTPAYFAL